MLKKRIKMFDKYKIITIYYYVLILSNDEKKKKQVIMNKLSFTHVINFAKKNVNIE